MKKIKETIKDSALLQALIYFLLIYALFAPFTKLFYMVTSDFFVEKTVIEDTNNLYPDSIDHIYLVDNQNDPLRDLSRYSYVAPITMTNNYEQNETYAMSLSLSKTYLSQKMRKELGYKSSFGKYSKGRDNRRWPIIGDLLNLGRISHSLPDFYERVSKMCNIYNPSFSNICGSKHTLTADLQPGETSETFYLDFPISHWEQDYMTEGAFELRLVRENKYYPVTIGEVVDCRSAVERIDERCNDLTK
jgi:hypothetical protein